MTDAAEGAVVSPDRGGDLASLEVRRIKAAARAKLFGEGGGSPLQISRYTVLRQLGVGGMGEVFLAYDAELGRKVAIKLVRLDRDQGVERASSRLLREAQALARLSHPNVVQVYEVGSFEGRVFIAMEFVHGVHMRRWIEQAPRTWRQILDLYIQAGHGLAAAHRLGMVHRDFKPENVLVGDDGRVRVVDFGLVRNAPDAHVPAEPGESASAEDLERSSRLTQSGALMGTPSYMSPEQFQGLKATPKSDQFAFCVALYRGLYGWHPFAAESRAELKRRVLSGRVSPPPRDARVPAGIFDVLTRGLQVDPEQRYPAMEELLAALDAPPRRRLRFAAAAVGAAVVGGLLAWFIWPDPRTCREDAQLAAAWNPDLRAALTSAFARTNLPGSAATAERIGHRLDRYAAALQGERAETCPGREPSTEQARRREECLDRRVRALGVLSRALVEADAALILRAERLAETLPSQTLCNDPALLAGGPAPTDDPATLRDLAAARRWLDDARILELRERPHDAAARAEHALSLAIHLRHGPLLAETHAQLGRLAIARGAHDQGAATLLDAVDLAESHRHDELAAELWLTLAQHALSRGDATLGDAYARRAAAARVRLGDDAGRVEIELLRGELHLLHKQFSAAELLFFEALERARDTPATRARIHLALARALTEQGRGREARDHIDRGHAILRDGPGPGLALALEELARLHRREGRLDEARRRFGEALALRSKGPTQVAPLARLHLALAGVAAEAGDRSAAAEHYDTALELVATEPSALPKDETARAEAWLAAAASQAAQGAGPNGQDPTDLP